MYGWWKRLPNGDWEYGEFYSKMEQKTDWNIPESMQFWIRTFDCISLKASTYRTRRARLSVRIKVYVLLKDFHHLQVSNAVSCTIALFHILFSVKNVHGKVTMKLHTNICLFLHFDIHSQISNLVKLNFEKWGNQVDFRVLMLFLKICGVQCVLSVFCGLIYP